MASSNIVSNVSGTGLCSWDNLPKLKRLRQAQEIIEELLEPGNDELQDFIKSQHISSGQLEMIRLKVLARELCNGHSILGQDFGFCTDLDAIACHKHPQNWNSIAGNK
ncbi:hypothetical protein J1N35_012992 [Gossypium stocksii]|uniref:Uncharacterized protein n=1 Tax=Gossypium stocksii TaxID=47602 RepID=A0A9D3VT41_9ROSI|nr:hypothetical protein J1N35_012992 [Gossypium stocksii]